MPDKKAHKVQISSTHVSPEAAGIYRQLVQETGGSAEAAIEAALLNTGGLHVEGPRDLNRNVAALRQKVESVAGVHDKAIASIEERLDTLDSFVDLAYTQIEDTLETLEKLKEHTRHARRHLKNENVAKSVNGCAAALAVVERSVEKVGLVTTRIPHDE